MITRLIVETIIAAAIAGGYEGYKAWQMKKSLRYAYVRNK